MEKFKILGYFSLPFNMSVLLEVNLGVVFDLLVPGASLCFAWRHSTSKETRSSQRNRNAAHTSKGVPLPEVVRASQGG